MFNILIICRLKWLLFLVNVAIGYPLREPQLKDETHFPNGTVIGKYTYMDNEGNPVYVKYFADESSYGVELQSTKIIDSSNEESLSQQKNDIMKTFDPTFENLELPKDTSSEKNKFNINNIPKTSNKVAKSREGYEVFYQNNLQNPNRCGSDDKVKIYLDKQRRIARDTMQQQADKFCEQIVL